MPKSTLSTQHHTTFEGIRQQDEQDNEFWLARQLARVLEYSQYRHFLPVLEKAREACRNSGQSVADHMEDVLTMVDIGSGAKREVEDVRWPRYADLNGMALADLENSNIVVDGLQNDDTRN